MNLTLLKPLVLSVILATCLLPLAANANNDTLLFEQVNPGAERDRLLRKFAFDKERAGSAIDNTKTQILKSQSKPYLPELYLRLAELYIEKARISYMEKRVQNGPSSSTLNTLEAENLKYQAIETYQRILNVYPDFEYRDKVHFYLAHEYKEFKKEEEMVAEYQTLIRSYPKSQYTPEAYLLLGDHYFSSNQSLESEKHYRAVLKYELSPARAIARYKLAWVHINKKDFKRATALLEESVRDATVQANYDIDSYDGMDIRLESLVDLAFIYPDHFKKTNPNHAIEYFKQLSWSRQSYILVLEKLGLRLQVKNKWAHSLAVYRALAQLQSEPESLISTADALFESYQKARSEKATINGGHNDVESLIEALRHQQASVHIDAEEKQTTEKRFEQYTRDIATKLHQQAKTKKSILFFTEAAEAYGHYLSFFSKHEKTQVMTVNYANALYGAHNYFEAAKQYETISQLTKLKDATREQYLYGATQAYYLALQEPEKLNLFKTVQARSGLVATGSLHTRLYPKSKHHQKVLFNVAWTKYDEGKFSEAAALFHSLVLRYPSSDLTDAALEIIIDAHQVVEDYAVLHQIASSLKDNKSLSKKNRTELARIAKVAQSKIVSNMTATALNNWDEGKKKLLDYAQEHASSKLGEQALLSLIATSKEQNDIATLQMAGANFVSKYPASADAESTLKVLIDSALKAGQFRTLVSSLENYNKLKAQSAQGKEFLVQAAQISARLNSFKQSNTLYKKLISSQKLTATELSQASVALAKNQIALNDHPAALQTLVTYRAKLPANKRLEVDSLAGLLFAQKNDLKNASKLYSSLAKNTGNKATGNAKVDGDISELGLRVNESTLAAYEKIQLTQGVDSALIQKKSEFLDNLNSNYQRILGYKAPEQSAKALLKLAEVNDGFAQFLLNAPVPQELTGSDRKKYISLVADQAAPYAAEAKQYQGIAEDLINKFGFLNKTLNSTPNGKYVNEPLFSEQRKQANTINSLERPDVLAMHESVLSNPTSQSTRLSLIEKYMELADYGQALLISESILEQQKLSAQEKSELYNLTGVALYELGYDAEARENFELALKSRAKNEAANANLAAIYTEFGATAHANKRYEQLPKKWNHKVVQNQLISTATLHYNKQGKR